MSSGGETNHNSHSTTDADADADADANANANANASLNQTEDIAAAAAGVGEYSSSSDWNYQYSVDEAATDVELLKRAWRNEKMAPEILSFQQHLVERSKEQLQLMEDNIEDRAGSGLDPVMLSLYQMDMDRMMFLLRSYLRVRLHKIEKHVLHILTKNELFSRLSVEEQMFAERFKKSLEKHLRHSVLDKLPPGYESFVKEAATSEEKDIVPEPQLDTFVFCKSKHPIASFQVDDKGQETVDLVSDDLHILRYKPIKRLVETGQIDLV